MACAEVFIVRLLPNKEKQSTAGESAKKKRSHVQVDKCLSTTSFMIILKGTLDCHSLAELVWLVTTFSKSPSNACLMFMSKLTLTLA